MQFIYPSFLFASFAIAIPIIIHLFNFRRYKKVLFSNVSLLKEIKTSTTSISKLKNFLVLICRILAILFAVLAFAKPFIPNSTKNNKSGIGLVSIYIDNSFSMQQQSNAGNMLQMAKNKAKEVVNAYSNDEKFQLVSNEFKGFQDNALSKEEMLEYIEKVEVSPVERKLNSVFEKQNSFFNKIQTPKKHNFIISDFQKNSLEQKDLKIDTTQQYSLVQINQNALRNVSIDSVWFQSPIHTLTQPNILNIKIKAYAQSQNYEFENIPLKLYVNNQVKTFTGVSLKANEEKILSLNFNNTSKGVQNCKVTIQDYPVTFDDNYYFTYTVSEKIKVLCLNQTYSTSAFENLYTSDEFEFSQFNVQQFNVQNLAQYDLIILNDIEKINTGIEYELKKYVEQKGSLCIYLPQNTEISSYNRFFETTAMPTITQFDTSYTTLKNINFQHPFFNDIFENEKLISGKLDLPKTTGKFNVLGYNKNYNTLFSFQNNAPYFLQSALKDGMIYVCYAPLNNRYNNFQNHSLFVPTMYKMALLSKKQYPLSYTIASQNTINLNTISNTQNALHLVNKVAKIDVIPEIKQNQNYTSITLNNQILNDGIYTLEQLKETLLNTAFNYKRSESNVEFYNKQMLTEIFLKNNYKNLTYIEASKQELTQTIKEINVGIQLWKYCILLSLLFLLFEILLLRFYSKIKLSKSQ
jgi:hypothetical protein